MAFPADELDAELYIDGAWESIISDVRGSSGIAISAGRKNETGRAVPSSLNMTLNDQDLPGKYVSRNPNSPYYGKLGLNTPCRVFLTPAFTTSSGADITDTFTRSTVNSWGTTTGGNGQDWTTSSLGTGTAAADFQVNGSSGTHYVSAANTYRLNYVSTVDYRNFHAVLSGIAVPLATGGDLEVALIYRATSTTSYGMVRLHFTTSNTVLIKCYRADDNTVQVGSTINTGITHTGTGQPLSMAVRVVGQSVSVRVWASSGTEPTTYAATFTDTSVINSGFVGIRSGRGSGNTNTANPQFTYSNLTFSNILVLFSGEIPSWKPQSDTTGRDVVVPVQAGGFLRRLTAGSQKPLMDTLATRIMLSNSRTLAYWPCADSENTAANFSSGIGGTPMHIYEGAANYRAGNIAPWLESTAASAQDSVLRFDGYVPTSSGDTVITNTSWVAGFEVGKLSTAATMTVYYKGQNWITGSTGERTDWTITLDGTAGTGGRMQLTREIVEESTSSSAMVINSDVPQLFDQGPHYISLVIEDDGSDCNYELYMDDLTIGTGTVAGATYATPKYIRASVTGQGVQFGYFSVHDLTSQAALAQAAQGWNGETAGERFTRLCAENSIAYDITGVASVTRRMGPQRIATLYEQFMDIETADGGIFGEPRDFLGVHYATRVSLYNRDPVAEFDYSNNDLITPFLPVDDDQRIANDVLAVHPITRESVQSVASDGPLGIDAVGKYDIEINPNVYTTANLQDAAEWAVSLGTVDEDRFPSISVNLARDQFQSSNSLLNGALVAEIGDWLTVANTPAWVSSETVRQLIRGYTMKIDNNERARGITINFNTTPARAYRVGPLNQGTWARLGSRVGILDGSIDDNDTSLNVLTTNGALFTTSDEPFFIVINGERMEVTAVSGASSPQFFTVTRSTNSVFKSHASGSVVQVYNRWRIAL